MGVWAVLGEYFSSRHRSKPSPSGRSSSVTMSAGGEAAACRTPGGAGFDRGDGETGVAQGEREMVADPFVGIDDEEPAVHLQGCGREA